MGLTSGGERALGFSLVPTHIVLLCVRVHTRFPTIAHTSFGMVNMYTSIGATRTP